MAAAALTLLVLQAAALFVHRDSLIGSDAGNYHAIALRLLAADTLLDPGLIPNAYWPPFYPMFLAAVYRIGSPHPLALRFAQFLLFVGTAAMTVALAGRAWPKGKRHTKLVILLSLLSLTYQDMARRVGYEMLMAWLLILYLLLFRSMTQRVIRKGTWWTVAAAAGVVGGLACLTQGKVMALICISGIWFLVVLLARGGRRNRINGLLSVLLLYLATVVTITPWAIRNWRVHHEVIPISTNGGINLYIGNNPYATGKYLWPTPEYDNKFPSTSPSRSQAIWAGRAREYMVANPGRTAIRAVQKLYYTMCEETPFSIYVADRVGRWSVTGGRAVSCGGVLVTWVLAAAAVVGGGAILRDRRNVLFSGLLVLTVIVFLGLCMLFFGGARFRGPLEPVLIIMESHGLARIKSWLAASGRPAASRRVMA